MLSSEFAEFSNLIAAATVPKACCPFCTRIAQLHGLLPSPEASVLMAIPSLSEMGLQSLPLPLAFHTAAIETLFSLGLVTLLFLLV